MTADDLPAVFAMLPREWAEVLPGWTAERFADVQRAVKAVSADRPIAPADPFRALRLVSPAAVKIVILGQDPYPTAGHADGLAFSAGRGKPKSLARIFEVLALDQPSFSPPATWRLDAWAHQGVLLLNPALTVEVGRSGSHLHCRWQVLTSQIVEFLCMQPAPPVFLLWGAKARAFFDAATAACASMLPRVLSARHPSYDFKREFMADTSHFAATRNLVDWWAFEK